MTVEWVKRWLPATFLLLSMVLPWWTYMHVSGHTDIHGYMSFPWSATVSVQETEHIWGQFFIQYNHIPCMLFVSSSIVVAGLCGLIDKSRVHIIGGLLGIVGVISYFILVFPKSIGAFYSPPWKGNPYFGIFYGSYTFRPPPPFYHTEIWFLSAGFCLALAGSIMLLLPTIRTLVERLRKQPQTSQMDSVLHI